MWLLLLLGSLIHLCRDPAIPSLSCFVFMQERAQMQRDLGKFQTENVELAAKVDLCAGHNGGGAHQRRNTTVKH